MVVFGTSKSFIVSVSVFKMSSLLNYCNSITIQQPYNYDLTFIYKLYNNRILTIRFIFYRITYDYYMRWDKRGRW